MYLRLRIAFFFDPIAAITVFIDRIGIAFWIFGSQRQRFRLGGLFGLRLARLARGRGLALALGLFLAFGFRGLAGRFVLAFALFWRGLGNAVAVDHRGHGAAVVLVIVMIIVIGFGLVRCVVVIAFGMVLAAVDDLGDFFRLFDEAVVVLVCLDRRNGLPALTRAAPAASRAAFLVVARTAFLVAASAMALAAIAIAVSVGAVAPARAPAIVLVIVFGSLAGFFLEQGQAVGDRYLVIIGVDFAEREKAVAIAAIIDEGSLKRGFYPRHLGQIDVPANLFLRLGLEIKFLDTVSANDGDPGFLRMRRVYEHLVVCHCFQSPQMRNRTRSLLGGVSNAVKILKGTARHSRRLVVRAGLPSSGRHLPCWACRIAGPAF